MTKKSITTSTYSADLEFDIEKHSNLDSTTRSMLQLLQGNFNPNSTKDYYIFFQLVYATKGYLLNAKSDFSKYASPKMLSISKRSVKIFKFTKLHKCLSLRYTCAQCSICKDFFSTFNTSKHYKEWETDSTPTISRKLLEYKGVIMCTDCIFVMHIEDDENE